jgi:M6 family metalloprotease-like protein
LTFDDLTFVVQDGAKAAIVSPSRDRTFDEKKPHVMLCIGWEPGTYLLEARDPADNVVGKAKFRVNSLWRREDLGPSKWFTGIVGSYSAGAAWGGGPAGPQNAATIPASGTRRIAILLVDTSSQRFTTDATALQGHRDRWLDEVFDGVVGGGVTRSSRLFYREASYNGFDLSAQVFGPVELSGTWTSYFNSDGSPKGGFYQACFTAGDGLIDYDDFDTLLCVSQSVTGPPMMSAWPYASIGQWGPYTTAEGNKSYGVISMPNEWGTTDAREIYETFSHELGHNLGMGDQYTPGVAGRNPGGWEMMHADNPFPHFTLFHRLALGWVQPGWVQAFNFQSMASPVDQTVTLSPIENGAPPSGRKAGIEIRLADGWNYYFEYRKGQAAQIGDRSLPTDDRVLGTDVVSAPYTPPIARPAVLLLNNDIDGDGAVLANGTDYEETDTTDPVFPTDFRVDVSGIDGTKANVRVRYGVNSRPDPSIRPWPAGPDRQWQSPDIEIKNARNQADPAWKNVPWVGNANTIVATIKNNGALDAPQVRANFFVKNYNVGGTPETFLGFDRKDVPAGATVDFQSSWTPPATGHYCVIVRIPLYQLPSNPAVVEMTELNNIAQSNYDRFISGTSTPSREITEVEVGNPYPERTRIWIFGGHSNPLYRTYLEHQWVYLDPGQTRKVRVMYEYAPDHLKNDVYPPELRKGYREFQRVPNRVELASFVEDPRDSPRHALQVLGGAQAEVVTGRKTRFERFDVRGQEARGTVVTAEDGKPVPAGTVIVRVSAGRGKGAKIHYQTAKLRKGTFVAKLKARGERVKAYYLPPPAFADCESVEEQTENQG